MTVVAEGVAYVPATCGELLQGVDDHGPLLVSLPFERYGTVRVTLTDEPETSVNPPLPKATAALQLTVDRCGWRGGVRVELGGELPHGLGLGSSTADVAGVIGGVCATTGTALTQRELLGLLVQVEPSDSSPLRGLWAIDHVEASRAVRLRGSLPNGMWLAVVDGSAAVSTQAVHRELGPGPRISEGMLEARHWQNADTIARVATESARRNQRRLPNPAFAAASAAAELTMACGVSVAHSGSACGVICADLGAACEARAELARRGWQATVRRAWGPGLRVRVAGQPRPRQWRPRNDPPSP